MEVFAVILWIIFLILLFMPVQEEVEIIKEFKDLTHCDKHEWIRKPNNVDDGYYLVCAKCKWLPESENYEP